MGSSGWLFLLLALGVADLRSLGLGVALLAESLVDLGLLDALTMLVAGHRFLPSSTRRPAGTKG